MAVRVMRLKDRYSGSIYDARLRLENGMAIILLIVEETHWRYSLGMVWYASRLAGRRNRFCVLNLPSVPITCAHLVTFNYLPAREVKLFVSRLDVSRVGLA